MWLRAPTAETALQAERTILAEIERLRQVFSVHDSESELSRLNRTSGLVSASTDLRAVLREYERWQVLSGGACNAQVGALVRCWAEAEQSGTEPNAAVLTELVRGIAHPNWVVDDTSGTVLRRNTRPLNLNSIAKGYIIQRAATAVRSQAPSVSALLLNLGGDLSAWGDQADPGSGWVIAVQDPFCPQDNAVPLGALRLHNAAVATSGGYQRSFTVGRRRYSHLLDPRTGYPAAEIAGATVVATDSVTANVLATTLCVLPVEAGLRLVGLVQGGACLIITADGRHFQSAGLGLVAVNRGRTFSVAADDDKKSDAWPEGQQVTVALELPKIDDAKKYRKPYVAVWVEDTDGKTVRTLTVWGNAPKYLKDLSDWWKIGKGDSDLVKTVTRATRGPGKYNLVWDGKDDKGHALGQGTYTIRVEVHREHGKHLRQSGKIECKADDAKVTLDKNEETGDTLIEYGKKK